MGIKGNPKFQSKLEQSTHHFEMLAISVYGASQRAAGEGKSRKAGGVHLVQQLFCVGSELNCADSERLDY